MIKAWQEHSSFTRGVVGKPLLCETPSSPHLSWVATRLVSQLRNILANTSLNGRDQYHSKYRYGRTGERSVSDPLVGQAARSRSTSDPVS
jgi:hypothetical protein